MKKVVLINIILILLIIVASFFAYFYFVKRDVSEVLQNYLPEPQIEKADLVANIYGEVTGKGITPSGVVISGDGKLYISDSAGHRVVIWDLNGRYLGEFGSYGDKPGQFKFPYGITILSGKIYVADPVLGRISIFDSKGQLIKMLSSQDPNKVLGFAALTTDGKRLYSTDVVNHQVIVMDPDGGILSQFGSKGDKPGQLSYPNGIAVRYNQIYVADSNNNRIEIFDANGKYNSVWVANEKDPNAGFSHPRGLAFDRLGHLYVVNMMGSKVFRLSPSGAVEYQWGRQGGGEYEFAMPLSLTIDSTGKIYIGDNLNHRISIYWFR